MEPLTNLSFIRGGNLLPLYNGRLGFRVHLSLYYPHNRALCGVELPYKTRPDSVYEKSEEYVCPNCLRLAPKAGISVQKVVKDTSLLGVFTDENS